MLPFCPGDRVTVNPRRCATRCWDRNGQVAAILRAGLDEAYVVGRTRGTGLTEDFVQRPLARCDGLPDEMKSSMLQDLERGRRLELPWLSGAIVRLGAELGMPTPTHAFIATALKLHTNGRGYAYVPAVRRPACVSCQRMSLGHSYTY